MIAMTQAEQIRQLKRQLKKAQTAANAVECERDGALKKLGRTDKTAKRADAKLNDNARQIMYLQRQRRALVALSNRYGLLGTDHDAMWNHVAELDRIIETPKLLKSITGCTPDQFAFKLKYFEPLAMGYGPLFRGDGRRASDPGNRYKLYPRHVLLLALVRYYTGMAEGALQPWFGVDQSGVSKYLDLAADILEHVVISPKFLTGLLEMAESVEDITELVPHRRLLVDGTHILRQRPGGKIQRKASYSRKKKQFTYNVQAMTNCAGLILNLSEAVSGSTHDYALFKKHMAEAGAWLLGLAETCRAGEKN